MFSWAAEFILGVKKRAEKALVFTIFQSSIFAAPWELPPRHRQHGESRCSAPSPMLKLVEVHGNL